MKPPDQMNQYLVGSIRGRSSIKIAHLVPQVVSEEKILKNLYRDNSILNTDIYF
jgi:hypothetical protein